MTPITSTTLTPEADEAPGPSLYKYMSYETCRIVLTNGTLRWTTPRLLNDPYDMTFDLHVDGSPAEVRALALELLWADLQDDSRPAPLAAFEAWKPVAKRRFKTFAAFARVAGRGVDQALRRAEAIDEMNLELQAWLQRAKILCLTETPGNMLMWSHYGQQHQGAVLRFDAVAESSMFSAAKRVVYTAEMPRLGDSHTMAGVIAGRPLDQKRLITAQVYSKALEWSYEREWRIQFGLGRSSMAPFEDLRFGEELLTGLVLGCRMPAEHREELAILARRLNPDVELLQATPDGREFKIDVTPFDSAIRPAP